MEVVSEACRPDSFLLLYYKRMHKSRNGVVLMNAKVMKNSSGPPEAQSLLQKAVEIAHHLLLRLYPIIIHPFAWRWVKNVQIFHCIPNATLIVSLSSERGNKKMKERREGSMTFRSLRFFIFNWKTAIKREKEMVFGCGRGRNFHVEIFFCGGHT